MAQHPILDTIASLREELDEANETIRLLRVAFATPSQFIYIGLKLSLSDRAVMEALFSHHGPMRQTALRVRIDVVLDRREVVELKTVDIVICRLRKKLAALPLPIQIRNQWGAGYYLTDEDKARFGAIRLQPEEIP